MLEKMRTGEKNSVVGGSCGLKNRRVHDLVVDWLEMIRPFPSRSFHLCCPDLQLMLSAMAYNAAPSIACIGVIGKHASLANVSMRHS